MPHHSSPEPQNPAAEQQNPGLHDVVPPQEPSVERVIEPLPPVLVLGAVLAVANGAAELTGLGSAELAGDAAAGDVAKVVGAKASVEAGGATEAAELAAVTEPVATVAAEAPAEDPPDDPAASAA